MYYNDFSRMLHSMTTPQDVNNVSESIGIPVNIATNAVNCGASANNSGASANASTSKLVEINVVSETSQELDYDGLDELNKYQNDSTTETESEDEDKPNAFETVETFSGVPLDDPERRNNHIYSNYNFDVRKTNNLVINQYKKQIVDTVDSKLITIIKGHTGCGKTTQVPQFILDGCREHNVYCNIIVTQPRRIAALSCAKRVSAERNWELGTLVGYQIALDRVVSEDTRLVFCTAGVLLQQLIKAQDLSSYTHIIIDEVHERDNETDFLLIVLQKLFKTKRNKTKIILMSATMDCDKFVNYFVSKEGGVKVYPPVIHLHETARFPITFNYLDNIMNELPFSLPENLIREPTITPQLNDVVMYLLEKFHNKDLSEHTNSMFFGSVLIFLPGANEIERMFEILMKRQKHLKKEKWNLIPLHSSISFEDQSKAFLCPPPGTRKIILATNVAESSITVPDVKYVIDFCLMKLLVQKDETYYNSLQLSWISKNQGTQRAGRAGRVMPGHVYRLVFENLYNDFDEECSPEMTRCSLETLVLRAKDLQMGSPTSILSCALDPPNLKNIERTILMLKEAKALHTTVKGIYVKDDGDLTPFGHIMAELPLDIQLSKLIIYGHIFGCIEDCIIMASAMSVRNVLYTPFKSQMEAYNSKLAWADYSFSDPITLLNVYRLWRYLHIMGKFKRSGGLSEFEWGRNHYVQIRTLKEIARLESEITRRLSTLGIVTPTVDETKEWKNQVEKPLILKLILAGSAYPNFFSNSHVDERESARMIGAKDPYSTVYLTGFPSDQPGPLYTQSIRQHFSNCGSGINVTFDGSCKVYVSFDNSATQLVTPFNEFACTGRIKLAVYRAIKLRHLKIPITIPILKPDMARLKAQEIFTDETSGTSNSEKKVQTLLPGLSISVLQIFITYIENPHAFWVHFDSQQYTEKYLWISHALAKPESVVNIQKENIVQGKVCVAPFTDEGITAYYRVRILDIKKTIPQHRVQVHYIDFGNKAIVNESQLLDFSEGAKKIGLMHEPGLAFKCSLAQIELSYRKNPKGFWSEESIKAFKTILSHSAQATIKIYSVVHDTIAVYMFPKSPYLDAQCTMDLDESKSVNQVLINQGFAIQAEESYSSQENHMYRSSIQSQYSSGHVSLASTTVLKEYPTSCDFRSPTEDESYKLVLLKGPKSPLEISLVCLSRKCEGMSAQIDPNSVNSVLLDLYPKDRHDRLLVASSVTQGHTSDQLTLRNTTLMPNIHGLLSLLSVIFAPDAELRTNQEKTEYTGALCGLGYDPDTGKNYYPENELEVTFDTVFDSEDLIRVNKLRFWMNNIISDLSFAGGNSVSKLVRAQREVRKYLLDIIGKKRESQPPQIFDNKYEWGFITKNKVLQDENPLSVFPLISGVSLQPKQQFPDLSALQANLDELELYANGLETEEFEMKCELCQINLEDRQNLKMHLMTALHKTRLHEFCLRHES